MVALHSLSRLSNSNDGARDLPNNIPVALVSGCDIHLVSNETKIHVSFSSFKVKGTPSGPVVA